ncbi:hypothetical protein AKO1_000538 [Acrasis kona]|uniref:Uncharacterized protein n=1 Tax=Acrasis kona TaxID=1008807 RepID=A0AAW2ZR24_9EUKA
MEEASTSSSWECTDRTIQNNFSLNQEKEFESDVTLKKGTCAGSCEIAITFKNDVKVSSFKIISSARIVEVLLNKEKQYLSTIKHDKVVGDNVYSCNSEVNKTTDILTLRLLSNNHQSGDKGTLLLRSVQVECTACVPSSEKHINALPFSKLMSDPSTIMAIMNNIGNQQIPSLLENLQPSTAPPRPKDDLEDKIKAIVIKHVDERMEYWEKRILEKISEK